MIIVVGIGADGMAGLAESSRAVVTPSSMVCPGTGSGVKPMK